MSRGIVARAEPVYDDRAIFLLDGTTIALAPEKELQIAFLPASNHKTLRINVVLHKVVVSDTPTLYVVTSLDDDALSRTELFKRRVEVEIDIRNLKVVMDSESNRAKSVDMFKNELQSDLDDGADFLLAAHAH